VAPIDALNDAQRAAVFHGGGPLLVVAGAGSGKTRVLTARIAHLLETGVRAGEVLAFTFTNRAAREMRERLERVVGGAARELWVGTFHATAVRILRRESPALGVPPGFAIYDREDQESLIRRVIESLRLPEDIYRPALVRERISSAKNVLVDPAELARLAVSPFERQMAACYGEYQKALRESGAFDFDDLIVETVRLFRARPDRAEAWGRRFAHVLVDEYQDTNHAQFLLVHALSALSRNLFVVGDDDQSIYGWRGADLSNLLDFETAFPGAAVVRLEQNYRSTARILGAANAVIANNRGRKGKTLWCDGPPGERLRFFLAADEGEEARRVRRWIEGRVAAGLKRSDCAVLYRTHAQSRALEVEMRQSGLGYQIVGGISFFQRREIKDLLAYLRLVANPRDTVSFWRVWNTPRRGLGPSVRAQVEAVMNERGIAPGEALGAVAAAGGLNRPARAGAEGFLALLGELSARRGESAEALLRTVLERTAYLGTLEEDEPREREERRAAIEELVAAAGAAEADLDAFLAEAALVTDADRLEEGADRVLLLTMHNAKGLEFDAVAIAGLEEGLLPHATALEDAAELEEERRLFYVAITRARREVLLTAAAFRRRWEGATGGRISRFVAEIPDELLEREESVEVRSGGGASRRSWHGGGGRGADVADDGWADGPRHRAAAPERSRADPRHRAVGREVHHEQFGRGVVVAAEGEGESARFTVRFGSQVKKVLGRFLSGGDDVDPS
jgi:DNA helicase-2/ATP-dependent DNA helicase PcrA